MNLASILLGLIACSQLCIAFRWQLKETIPAQKFFTFSERFMFASEKGPALLEQGSSFINTDVTVTTLSTSNSTLSIGFAVYATEEFTRHENLVGLCSTGPLREGNPWALAVESEFVQTNYIGTVQVYATAQAAAVTKFKRTAHISHKYAVRNEMWHNVVFLLCNQDSGDGAEPIATIEGEVAFRNPYGYIPAELFGILPFEGARMVAYVLFSCYFLYHYVQNKDSILPLHNAFLLVFLFALAEATLWYATYQSLNISGEPYCCPFPPTVVGSLVLQVFRQTFSRTLLLVVCLGYGIVRPRLMAAEWVAVSVVSLFYFVAATVSQVSDILQVQSNTAGDGGNALAFRAPELFLDVVFLSWIYLAIGSTIRILTEFNQTAKLRMYQQLVAIIGLFAGLFTLATVSFLLDEAGYLAWPWQWAWVQQVLWESLNFAVLAAVCFICKPTENSRLLSYASQLPTEDPDEEEEEGDIEMHGRQKGGGMGSSRHGKVGDQTDEDDWDSIGGKTRGEQEISFNGDDPVEGFEALPAAEDDDDEDYGLHD